MADQRHAEENYQRYNMTDIVPTINPSQIQGPSYQEIQQTDVQDKYDGSVIIHDLYEVIMCRKPLAIDVVV